MKQKNLEYVPKNLSRKDTVVVVRELKKIESTQGIITPAAVVAAAAPSKSPLHGFFEWDNKQAANKYREHQARQLIASVYVRDADSETAQPVRAFVNVKVDVEGSEENAQGYLSQGALLKNPGLQQQVIAYARSQLLLWRAKFGGYEQFYEVARAIDEIVSSDKNAAA